LTRDDALEKSLDDLEEKYQAEDKDVAPSDVEQKPHVSTYHVSSGLAMLPKVSRLLLLRRRQSVNQFINPLMPH